MYCIETKRLLLRPFAETDLSDFNHYAKNPLIGPNAGWKPHESMEESSKILSHFIGRETLWAIAEKSSGTLIGSIELKQQGIRGHEGAMELGYVLDSPYWGCGYMPEAARAVIRYAFDELHLSVLGVIHYPFNQQSRRVIEKCGFRLEGTLRRMKVRYDGEMLDFVCYSLTREEYDAMRKDFEQ